MESTIAVDQPGHSRPGNFGFDATRRHRASGSTTTHEMVLGYQAQGPGSSALRYNVADRNAKLLRNEFFDAPFAAMVHDFFVTDTHAIFPIFPITASIERVMKGGPMLAWEPDKGTHFGVIPRDGHRRRSGSRWSRASS
jgi:carotenoid cleavage dioxygenase